VRIRRRKPWVLARRRLFGWKVRLLTRCSPLLPGDRRSGPGVPVVRGEWDESPVRAPSETRTDDDDGEPRHGQAKATEKQALSTIRERYGQGQTHRAHRPVILRGISRTARLPVQRASQPSSFRPDPASLRSTRRAVQDFSPRRAVRG
jgi:hypothetical protein